MTKYTKLVTTATVPTCEAVSTSRPVTSTKWVSRGKPGETHEELKEYGNVSAVVREAVERWLTEHAPARKSKTRR